MNYAGRFNSFILKGQNVFDAIKAYHEMDGITHLEFNYPEHFAGYDLEEIKKAIQYARSEQGKERAKKAVNPYGKGDTSAGIVKEIKNYLKTQGNTRKKFYDIPGWNTIGE